jgi:hypothetical protein
MTTISLEANVKSLVTSAGLSLASSGNTVTLSLNNSGLAQILSQILQSNSSVTVNYSSTTGTLTFTSTANVTQSQLAAILANTLQNTGTVQVDYDSQNDTVALNVISAPPPTPLIITNKNQFNSNNEISVGLNQDVFLLATNVSDWDSGTYYLMFPSSVSEPSKHFLFFRNDLPSNSNVEFSTGNLSPNYNLNTLSNQVLMVVITPDGLAAIYGSMLYVSP